MTRATQHPKVFVCVSLMGLALVLSGTAAFSESDYGTTNGIYWEISVYNLSYDLATQTTTSRHRYLVENNYVNDDGEYAAIKPKFRFSHFVVKLDGSYTYNEDGTIKFDSSAGFGATVPATGVGDHSETLGVSVDNLEPGDYKIYAYTEVDIYEASDTGGLPIVSGLRVEAEKKFAKVEED